jgi:hypothetical protein
MEVLLDGYCGNPVCPGAVRSASGACVRPRSARQVTPEVASQAFPPGTQPTGRRVAAGTAAWQAPASGDAPRVPQRRTGAERRHRLQPA